MKKIGKMKKETCGYLVVIFLFINNRISFARDVKLPPSPFHDQSSRATVVRRISSLLAADVEVKGHPFPKINGPNRHEKVCIVGAGPAGIHMAMSLKVRGFSDITLFEKTGRVGGKSYDTQIDGLYRPQGAIFLQADYFDNVIKLARKYNVGQLQVLGNAGVWYENIGLDKNRFTTAKYLQKSWMDITNNASPSYNLEFFVNSTVKYGHLHYSMFGKYDGELMQRPNDAILKYINGTFKTFLQRNNLTALIPLLDIIHTAQGYGYLDEIGTLYGLLWNTPRFILSYVLSVFGIANEPYGIYVLKNGYEEIWNTIVEKEHFDIRFNSNIVKIHRSKSNVKITHKDSFPQFKTEKCGFLIWTPPMPELLKYLSNPSKEEKDLFRTLDHHVFVSTLIRDKGTLRNNPLCFYHETIAKKIEGGVVADLDIDGVLNVCYEDEFGIGTNCSLNNSQYNEIRNSSRIISSVQLRSTEIDEETSNNIAKNHYEMRFNSTSIEFLNTKTWEYFYKWDPTELAKGNHWKVFNIQGRRRTWYAGASVIFESVKSVMEYNELLIRQHSMLQMI